MSNILTLLRVEILQALPKIKLKNKNISSAISFILMLILGLGLSTLINLGLIVGQKDPYLSSSIIVTIVTFLIFNQAIIGMKNIFISNDYDMLESMPIKKWHIVFSKLLGQYVLYLFYSFVLIVPNVIIIIVMKQNYVLILKGILDVLFLPIFPMIVASILSTFISYISSHWPKFSNIIDLIFNLLIIFSVFIISFTLSFNISSQVDGGNVDFSVFDKMSWINPPYYFSKEALVNSYNYLIYIGISLLILVLNALFVSKFYRRIHILISHTRSNNVYVKKDIQTRNQLKAFISLDISRLKSSKFYLTQNLFGLLLGIVFTVVACVYVRTNLNSDAEEFGFLIKYQFLLCVVPIYFSNIVVPTQGIINFEGKSLYLLKSMPIDNKAWIKSKLIVAITVPVIVSIIEGILISVILPFNFFTMMCALIVPLSVSVATNIVSLYINLKHPKFNYRNEQEMIKTNQFKTVLMTFLSVILIIVGLIFFGVYLTNFVKYIEWVGLLIIFVVFTFVSILFYNLLLHDVDKCVYNFNEKM